MMVDEPERSYLIKHKLEVSPSHLIEVIAWMILFVGMIALAIWLGATDHATR